MLSYTVVGGEEKIPNEVTQKTVESLSILPKTKTSFEVDVSRGLGFGEDNEKILLPKYEVELKGEVIVVEGQRFKIVDGQRFRLINKLDEYFAEKFEFKKFPDRKEKLAWLKTYYRQPELIIYPIQESLGRQNIILKAEWQATLCFEGNQCVLWLFADSMKYLNYGPDLDVKTASQYNPFPGRAYAKLNVTKEGIKRDNVVFSTKLLHDLWFYNKTIVTEKDMELARVEEQINDFYIRFREGMKRLDLQIKDAQAKQKTSLCSYDKDLFEERVTIYKRMKKEYLSLEIKWKKDLNNYGIILEEKNSKISGIAEKLENYLEEMRAGVIRETNRVFRIKSKSDIFKNDSYKDILEENRENLVKFFTFMLNLIFIPILPLSFFHKCWTGHWGIYKTTQSARAFKEVVDYVTAPMPKVSNSMNESGMKEIRQMEEIRQELDAKSSSPGLRG